MDYTYGHTWDWDDEQSRNYALHRDHPCWGALNEEFLAGINNQLELLHTFEDSWERSKCVYGVYLDYMEAELYGDPTTEQRRWMLDRQLEMDLTGISTGEEGHDDGDTLVWMSSEHDSDDPAGWLKETWNRLWEEHENWGDEDLKDACWDEYSGEGPCSDGERMEEHIRLYERIRASITEEFQKVRQQVFDCRQKKRDLYLALNQEPGDENFQHYSDFTHPEKNPSMLKILSFTDEQIEEWIKEAKEEDWTPECDE